MRFIVLESSEGNSDIKNAYLLVIKQSMAKRIKLAYSAEHNIDNGPGIPEKIQEHPILPHGFRT